MALNVFADNRTEESVAYDLALILAAKDSTEFTPETLIQRVADLLPACRIAAKKRYSDEAPKQAMSIGMDTTF